MGRFTTTRLAAGVAGLACAATAVLAATSVAETTPTAVAAKRLVAVSVTSCSKGHTAARRSAVFKAEMRTVPKASRLGVRFELQERMPGAHYRAVTAPRLRVWRVSRPGVGKFAYSQRVRALAQGSEYRVVVRYRWQNARRKVIKRLTRSSKACRQAEALPDLAIQRIAASRVDGSAGKADYAVTLINRGSATAPASNVKLLVDGSTVDRAAVPGLDVGQTTKVVMRAARCSANITAVADPDALVRESSEANNSRTADCPFG